MSNYDFTLDMETDNSNSLILRNIKPNSTVLEMGCAYGRMTKYLKEQLNCSVCIVEKDEAAGTIAQQYATCAKLGTTVGNLEQDNWSLSLVDQQFDYIIFADVLEHLISPEQTLELALKFLAPHGSVFISIPNIAHNAVLIDLLQDKFDYRESGILDKTHLKFFTYHSLKTFIATHKLIAVKEMNAINVVDNTEFKNSYSELPVEVSSWLQQREFGEVYQFVWQLKKADIKLSILIPVFNKVNFTKSALEDLKQLNASEVEIIVIDNASTDETPSMLLEYGQKMPNLKVITNKVNVGFGKAMNQSYAIAGGTHVMFLNNDIRVKDNKTNWIDLLIDKCGENNLVGPTGGKVDSNNFQFMYETNDSTKSINYLSGWCLMGRKNVLNKLLVDNDLFDPKFFCYFEDTDLSFRATEANIQLDMVDVPVVHFGKVSSKQLNTHSLYKQSKEIFHNKWKRI